MVNLHLLTRYAKLYPQNGDRILTTDSVTSFRRMYKCEINAFWLLFSPPAVLVLLLFLMFYDFCHTKYLKI